MNQKTQSESQKKSKYEHKVPNKARKDCTGPFLSLNWRPIF